MVNLHCVPYQTSTHLAYINTGSDFTETVLVNAINSLSSTKNKGHALALMLSSPWYLTLLNILYLNSNSDVKTILSA